MNFIMESAAFMKKPLLLVAGLEPARCCHRGILSPLRLPIPPHKRFILFKVLGKLFQKSICVQVPYRPALALCHWQL